MATLRTEDTKIDAFDLRRSVFSTRSGSILEILPGPHELAVSVFVSEGAPDLPTFRQSEVVVLCFDAVATHDYVARPVPDGTFTRPELYDEMEKIVVSRGCRSHSEQ